jgi:hypothetical protein
MRKVLVEGAMPEWAEGIALLNSTIYFGWRLLQPNCSTAVLWSLAGAFGGAWAAQKIAHRAEFREELLKEVRNTIAAAMMVYGIANNYFSFKRHHVKRHHEKYHDGKERFKLVLKAKRAGTVPPRQAFEFEADMQTLMPLYSRTEQIQKLLVEKNFTKQAPYCSSRRYSCTVLSPSVSFSLSGIA